MKEVEAEDARLKRLYAEVALEGGAKMILPVQVWSLRSEICDSEEPRNYHSESR